MSTVIHIHSEQEFNDAIKDADFKATIVDFTATWFEIYNFSCILILN